MSKGWFKLGLAELLSGKYIESLHSFKEAYDRDKTFIEALYNMGVVYDLLGDDYKAFTYYRLYYRKVKGEKEYVLNIKQTLRFLFTGYPFIIIIINKNKIREFFPCSPNYIDFTSAGIF